MEMHSFRIAVVKKVQLVYCKCMACCNDKISWNRLFALRVRSVKIDILTWSRATVSRQMHLHLKTRDSPKYSATCCRLLKRSRWLLVIVIWPNLWPLVFDLCRGQPEPYHRVLLDRGGDEQLVWAFERTNRGQWRQCDRTGGIYKN